MPAIKLKKAAAEHQAEKEREERERESEEVMAVKTVPSTVTIKPKEASIGGSLMKGLDANILLEKRKRTIPPSEQKLIDWMEANLESKEECRVSLNSLYDYFGEACSFDGTAVVDQPMFNKRITDKFGKAFALKESSPYKGLIKEKKSKGKGSTVKADTLKIKMKDIIEEAIKEAGNPVKGVRFFSLKQYIACNYPALRVDLRPAYLKVALERGVKYGYIQLVRGVGLAGYYRLPVDEEPDETEEKSAEKEGEEAEGDKENQNGDAEAPEGEKSEENTAAAAAAAPSPKKKSRKRKAPEKEEGEEGEKTTEGEGDDGEGKKKKKKKTKRRRPRPDSYHVAPLKIEDTFALAMTYMCEPKQTSFGKIKKYITENYPHVDTEAPSELKSAMESGERKGFWEHITGQGLSGTFQLMIDEFDPNSTDNVEDMICSAIIACNEPKQASSNLLKKYVMEFHPDFNIQSRPHRFKMALERALKKQKIIQLSGIGASGSFQMWSPFTPTPSLLAGEEDDYVEDIFTEKQEMYIPRGTKSRGGQSVRKAPADRSLEGRPKPKKRAPPTNRSASQKKAAASKSRSPAKSQSRSRGKASYAEDEGEAEVDEEVEEEVEEDEGEPPAKKKAKKSGKAKKGKSSPKPKKKTKKPVSRAQITDTDEEGDDDESEAKKKSKSKAQTETSPRKSKARPSYAEDEDGSEDEDSAPRSKGRSRESSGAGRRSSKVNYNENEEEEEDADRPEYTPRKSKSRGGEDDEEDEPRSSPKKRGKKRR
ncbi:eukaryotic translation initiation factor 5B-like [Haliotis rubra]|uniref:eukaryotic translation initiation factor 5B-like n=1 Tax=Haliotis rubra TaxID=36100 RepID=UPI001EE5DB76|nr:eukaryotic translation initiation factor 5B-like [Haliotis rubra]